MSALPPLPEELRFALESIDDAVLMVDRDWVLRYGNANALRVSRLQPEDLGVRTHWEIFPDTVGTELEAKYRRAMEQGTVEHHDFFYPPFNIWVSVRAQPSSNGLVLIYRDVTAVKEQEQARQQLTEELGQVLDVTSDAIVSLDRNFNFTFVNRRAREVLAPAGPNITGRNLWELFPAGLAPGAPFHEQYTRSMEHGETTDFEVFYPEPLNLWLRVQSYPAKDGIIIFFRDITAERAQQKMMRAKQQETERQWAEIEAVYRTAPIGLALLDPVEFRYLRLNNRQAEFFGLRPEQMVGRTLTEMAPIPGLRELFEQVARGEPVRNYPLEGELVTRPGEHRYWTVNYSPVFAIDGSVQAISAASLEITQQKRAEAALMQSEKLAAVGRLATSISHEINNPLESVTNLLFLISMNPGLDETTRGYVETAQSELQRVSQIATQTLRFHRQSARPTRVNAASLAKPVLDLYQRRLANSAIKVETAFLCEDEFVCFENDIRQVLNNLMANAIDAMRGGGRLLVRSHRGCQATGRLGVRLTVADTGHGMPKSVQKRVLEPFFTTKDLNGNGLGLWISSEIVARHHGELRFRSSESPTHHGTVFTLFLPLDESPPKSV